MTRVKICGLCRPQDAAAAVESGADYVGVILAPQTRRSQTLSAARQIFDSAGSTRRVGVFVNPQLSEIVEAIDTLKLAVVQLHGDEPPAFVQTIDRTVEIWKAVRVRQPEEVGLAASRYSRVVQALLLDAFHPSHAGGSGAILDWSAMSTARAQLPAGLSLVLAGGLTPDNVVEAVHILKPDVVDVSSGVEQAVGEKSAERMRAFVAAVDTMESDQ
jgi:phosphoribosylanthranilate isomerase